MGKKYDENGGRWKTKPGFKYYVYLKTCLSCGRDFETTRKWQNLCSSCRVNKRYYKVCKYCGRKFRTRAKWKDYCRDCSPYKKKD
ncbi:MAG: hypothetical protein ACTSO2_13785 [Promethearchaeota archaeon]